MHLQLPCACVSNGLAIAYELAKSTNEIAVHHTIYEEIYTFCTISIQILPVGFSIVFYVLALFPFLSYPSRFVLLFVPSNFQRGKALKQEILSNTVITGFQQSLVAFQRFLFIIYIECTCVICIEHFIASCSIIKLSASTPWLMNICLDSFFPCHLVCFISIEHLTDRNSSLLLFVSC